MRGFTAFAGAALALLTPAIAGATANYVYHEQTTSPTGGTCGNYLTTPAPGPSDAYPLEYRIEYQFFTDTTVVYYTTDGSAPSGAFGVPGGTTQVVAGTYSCTYDNGFGQIVDVASAVIAAQAAGTTVKYVVGAWHSGVGAGPEVFANSGTCGTCTPCENSSCATVFAYTVTTPLADAGNDASSEASVDSAVEAASDSSAEAAADGGLDAGTTDAGNSDGASGEAGSKEGGTEAGSSDGGHDAADGGLDSGALADARDDVVSTQDSGLPGDSSTVDTGSTTGEDAASTGDSGNADTGAVGSPDATVPGSGDGGEALAPLPGSSNGCGCSIPGAPGDLAGAGVAAYALAALVARARRRRR
jgi:MYXO-CTERM domain-containing protein